MDVASARNWVLAILSVPVRAKQFVYKTSNWEGGLLQLCSYFSP